jgi:hypothetical protein
MTQSDDAPTQLSLLGTPDVPLQFRLDAATCQRGRRHIAEIRQMLEERRRAREAEQRSDTRAQLRDRAA